MKDRLKNAAALVSLIALLSAPAAAQTPERALSTEAVQTLHRFSICLGQRRAQEARALLAMDFRTPAYRDRLRNLAQRHHGCMPPGRLQFASLLFAGGLAESLVEQDLRDVSLASSVGHDPGRAPIAARDNSEFVALCTVRTAPAEVAALLASDPDSSQEAAAASILASYLARCAPAGSQLRINRPGLRAILALAAHRLMVHNQPAGAGGD